MEEKILWVIIVIYICIKFIIIVNWVIRSFYCDECVKFNVNCLFLVFSVYLYFNIWYLF